MVLIKIGLPDSLYMPGQTQPGTQEPSIASAGSDDGPHTGPRQIINE